MEEKQEQKLKECEAEISFAFKMLKEQSKITKMMAITILILVAATIGTNVYWLNFINGYTFESIEIQTDSGGSVVYQNGEVNTNGKTESEENDAKR